MKSAYIVATGSHLPGNPVDNDHIENVLGLVGGQPSRIKKLILRQNGIRTRHYALDAQGTPNSSVSDMACEALLQAWKKRKNPRRPGLLCCATTQGDAAVPGVASMVHGRIGERGELAWGHLETASFLGVCGSSLSALKNAWLQVAAGEHATAAVVASEYPSRLFLGRRFSQQTIVGEDGNLPADVDFLRWMLSDGAGAAYVEDKPAAEGLSLRIEWIDIRSHSDAYPVCMYAGLESNNAGAASWIDAHSFSDADRSGAINLRQDMRLVDHIVTLGVAHLFDLVERKKLDWDQGQPGHFDWLLCHYSSHHFKSKILALLAKGGVEIPESKWFSNLYHQGNTGSASILIMLDEFLRTRKDELKIGQKILLMVPESGRFLTGFALLTVVGPNGEVSVSDTAATNLPHVPSVSAPAPDLLSQMTPLLKVGMDRPEVQSLVRQLTGVWAEFQARLQKVPIVERLHEGRFSIEDYRTLLRNLRQQVVDGALWISRAASHISEPYFELRSAFIQHSREEHRDFKLLEQNYVAVGGTLADILNQPKNIGSEALSGYLLNKASQPDPFDMLGAMFIIEGMGNFVADRWARQIRELLDLNEEQITFMSYHGANDENHFERLERAVDVIPWSEKQVSSMVKTARTVARLYCLQLEALDEI